MAGTHEGRVLVFPQLTEALTPFEDKPQARKIVDADGGNLTLMELAAGQSWHEHHSVHPVFVQVLKGEVIFHVKDRDITLVPGKPIHVDRQAAALPARREGLHPAGDHADRRIAPRTQGQY